MEYIDKFAGSLVHLHLDFEWYFLTVGKGERWGNKTEFGKNWKMEKLIRQKDPLRVQLVNICNGMPHASKTFPNLKTLAVFYPDKNEGIEATLLKKVFLVKFPALENLHLIHFGKISRYSRGSRSVSYADGPSNSAIDKVKAGKFLETQKFWEVCSKLKRITVVNNDNYDDPSHIVVQEIR